MLPFLALRAVLGNLESTLRAPGLADQIHQILRLKLQRGRDRHHRSSSSSGGSSDSPSSSQSGSSTYIVRSLRKSRDRRSPSHPCRRYARHSQSFCRSDCSSTRLRSPRHRERCRDHTISRRPPCLKHERPFHRPSWPLRCPLGQSRPLRSLL